MKMDQQLMIKTAIGSVLALSLAGGVGSAVAADDALETERCAGIVKEGMNDCATSAHSCAGNAKEDYDPDEWITLAKGTCEKIAGGTLVEGEAMKM